MFALTVIDGERLSGGGSGLHLGGLILDTHFFLFTLPFYLFIVYLGGMEVIAERRDGDGRGRVVRRKHTKVERTTEEITTFATLARSVIWMVTTKIITTATTVTVTTAPRGDGTANGEGLTSDSLYIRMPNHSPATLSFPPSERGSQQSATTFGADTVSGIPTPSNALCSRGSGRGVEWRR